MLRNSNGIKKINIAIIVFAVISLAIGVYLFVVSTQTYEEYGNDEGASEISEILKSDSFDSDEISAYENLLKNNGYNMQDVVKYYTEFSLGFFLIVSIWLVVINLFVVLFSAIIVKRSSDDSLVYFCTKYSVITLILSILTLNLVNVVLSSFSIAKIRKKMFS